MLNCTVYQTAEEGDVILDHWAKHIPTAEYFDIKYIRDMSKPYPYMMPSQQHFTDAMKALRIKRSTRVVFYDSKPGYVFQATRAYFMFRAFGHTNVSVLNGGLTKWVAESRKVDSDPQSTDDYAYKLDASLITSYEQIRQLEKAISANESDTQILDVRVESAYQAGKIEHAKNVFWKQVINEQAGTVKSPEQIREVLSSGGIDLTRPIVASCNSGMTATFMLAALQTLGLNNVPLYDGSWQEYMNRKKAE